MKLRLCFFMLALGICGAVVQGCDDNDDNLDVLDKLQAAFSQKYPEASPKWKTRSNYYIADFQNQNYAAEAWFTSDAVWLMTETDLPHASLPEAVKNAFKNSEYGQWSLDDVDMLVREGMEPVYVLEVEQGPREMDLYYNAEGILIKVVEDSEDDSEDYLPIELPEEVKNFLQEKYAASKIVETDQEHGQFEVDIIHDGVAKEVLLTTAGIGFPHLGRSVWILFRKSLKLRSGRKLTISMSVMKPTMSRNW